MIKKLYCKLCCYFENHRFSHYDRCYDADGETLDGVAHQYTCMSCGKERRFGYDEPLYAVPLPSA